MSRYRLYDYLNLILNRKTNKISCLDKSSNDIFELFFYDSYKYKIENLNIFLLKPIGEISDMGTIFLSKMNNLKFITKIMLLNNFSITELKITQHLSDISYKNKNIHLPLLYGHSICNKINIPLKLIDKEKFNPKNSYYCLFIELYEGSMYILLMKLLNKLKLKEFVINIILQCFISILSCHNNNIYHNDTHINNFLFSIDNYYIYKIYKYSFNDLEFNLNAYPFIITICDFGISNYIDDNQIKDFRNDYKSLLDSIDYYYITKNKLDIDLSLLYDLLNKSNNDYEFFMKLKENNFFNNNNYYKKTIKINLI